MEPEVKKRLTVEDRLKQLGVTRVKYYYHKTPLANNIFTACLLITGKVVLARGLSICSLLDVFSKVQGRGKSLKMALKAAEHEKTSEEIVFSPYRWIDEYVTRTFRIKTEANRTFFNTVMEPRIRSVIKTIKTEVKDSLPKIKMSYQIHRGYPILETLETFSHRSTFQPKLTKLEQKLL